MFGDTEFSPENILAGPETFEVAGPSASPGPFGPFGSAASPVVLTPLIRPYDQWGLTQIPTASGLPFTPLAAIEGTSLWLNPTSPFPVDDPALGVILDFLATWLVTDANVQVAWKQIAGASGLYAVRRIFAHDPGDVSFNTSNLPALFLWRDSSKQEYEADDWLTDKAVVKGLWVYPLAQPQNQQVRQTIAATIAKLIAAGIERGRTPSWRQPGDPDPLAFQQGSLFYPYANFNRFFLEAWRKARLDIPSTANGSQTITSYPAVEMTFSLWETYDYGLGQFPRLASAFDTVLNPAGQPVVSGSLDH